MKLTLTSVAVNEPSVTVNESSATVNGVFGGCAGIIMALCCDLVLYPYLNSRCLRLDFIIKTVPSCCIGADLAVCYGHVLRVCGIALEGSVRFKFTEFSDIKRKMINFAQAN